ncbi:hypothetical protein SAMN05216296_1023 [Pseudomonas pohangensis]|uniref:Uncharacterized protein n=1 Tax=Pseudomonas pohangensis TaxID=364197 RepID=A0A1H2ESW4_9PSED|nr:hypothetical protein [Pseudomonas pohangensis]SDT97818.1 hypothetical protein SAMN05216296_1023 [Pseudomonas pohangensis]
MAGSFLKFKPVLTSSEAVELLSELVRVSPTDEDIRELITNGYLTPIYGYGRTLFGISQESFESDSNAAILAVSHIGVVSSFGYGNSDMYGPLSETTDGQSLVFLATDEDYDLAADFVDINHFATVHMDHEDASFLTAEIFSIAHMAISNDLPVSPEEKSLPRISFNADNDLPFLMYKEVASLHGFNTPSGIFSSRPKPVVMDRQPAIQIARPSHLLAIAGLLELLLDDSRPRYQQGTAAEAIEEKGWRGASASGLTKLFAEARAAATEAEKVAQAKAEARGKAASRAKI